MTVPTLSLAPIFEMALFCLIIVLYNAKTLPSFKLFYDPFTKVRRRRVKDALNVFQLSVVFKILSVCKFIRTFPLCTSSGFGERGTRLNRKLLFVELP